MTYVKQTWADAPATTSPLVSARLNHLEDGVFAVDTAAAAALADAETKYVKPSGGIPKNDLVAAVQASLTRADLALLAVTKSDVGLGNVDNTPDSSKPVSTAQQAALDGKLSVLTPEAFGAVGNGSTNDTTALNNCFAAAAGKIVWLDSSKTYAHNNLLTIGQNGTTVTGGGTLKATDNSGQKSAVNVTGNNVTIDHVTLTCPGASVRRPTGNDCKLQVLTCSGTVIRHVTVDGSSNFGFIFLGVTNYFVESCVSMNTMADGYHNSYGSSNGLISNCRAENNGDDGFAVVSYAPDPAICSNITIRGFSVKNGEARGISVVGGTNIRYFDGEIDDTAAAAIYVASEVGNPTYGVSDVVISNVDVAHANSSAPGIITGAILVYNDRPAPVSVDTISFTDIRLRDTDVDAVRQISIQNLGTGTLTGVELGPMTFSGAAPSNLLYVAGTVGYVDNTTIVTAGGTQTLGNKTLTAPVMTAPVLGTPASGTLTNCTGLPVAGIVGSTSAALGVGTIELGAPTDTTLSRSAAGKLAVEGVEVVLLSGAQTLTGKTLTSPTLTSPTMTTPALGTPTAGTLTNCTGLPVAGIVGSTSTALGVGTIELGAASDTTLSRSAAGKLAVEGIDVALLSGAQTLTGKTLTNPIITNYTESVVLIGNSGTSKTIDLTNGTVQTCTLTGNCTFTMPTVAAGKSFAVYLYTGAGGFTASFAGVKWPANAAPAITSTASRMDIITFVSDGIDWYGSFTQNYTP